MNAHSTTLPILPRQSSLWLESPLWDGFWMLSGLWITGLILLAQSVGAVPQVPRMLAFGALLLLWGGHILSPMVVSWLNQGFRRHMLNDSGRFIGFPLAILGTAILFGILGDLSQWAILPAHIQTQINPRFALFYTFLLWNTWHFSAQHFGVLAIYRKGAQQFSQRDRLLDRAFCVLMTCFLLPVAWYSQARVDRLGPLFQYLPEVSGWENLNTAVIVASGVLTVFFMGLEVRKPNGSFPRACYILSIGIQPIFGALSYPLYHMAVFSVCHWMIEFALVSRIWRNQTRAASGPVETDHRKIRLNLALSLKPALVLVLLSIPMYFVFFSPTVHHAIANITQPLFESDVYFGHQVGSLPFLLGAVSGAYFGISFVHFLYDRYIYAFSRPEVKDFIAPHLFRSIY